MRISENGELENFYWQPVIARGFEYTLDEDHRAIAKRAVDGEGNTVLTADGMRETRYIHDPMGNTVSTAYYDRLGRLLPVEYVLPLEGNWEFDSLGVVLNGAETAFVEREYDQNGLYVSERNIGVNGEPVADPQGRVLILYLRDPLAGSRNPPGSVFMESRWRWPVCGPPGEPSMTWEGFWKPPPGTPTARSQSSREVSPGPGSATIRREPEDDILLRPGEQACDEHGDGMPRQGAHL